MSSNLTIGFLGAGKMATALAQGFARAGLTGPEHLLASDPVERARDAFSEGVGARAVDSNQEILRFAEVILLAVKPDQVDEVLADVHTYFTEQHLLISIAAGVTLARLEDSLGRRARVIRVMPNTPALVGASASAFALGKSATVEDGELVNRLFSSVGLAVQVKEGLLDAVTGLSGSGPAYVYMMIEALSDGGVAAGLPREISTRLACQTLLGSAKMVLETGMHPAVLKDMVASPGGTTIEGLYQLEKGNFRGTIMNAVRAASDKSHTLGLS
jgi:pyrroline-5-carboxylate reductase